jgi:hypothetical protein
MRYIIIYVEKTDAHPDGLEGKYCDYKGIEKITY